MTQAVPKSRFDVSRAIARPALTPIEGEIFERCRKAAEANLPAPSIEELMEAIGANGISTVPGVMRRLEKKGYITRTLYQRGRTICIAGTNHCTLPPADLTPHWRTRTERVPAPAIQPVRQKEPEVACLIEREARQMNRPLATFLADLVYIGWAEYRAEKEREGE